jgi:hypothetical protein
MRGIQLSNVTLRYRAGSLQNVGYICIVVFMSVPNRLEFGNICSYFSVMKMNFITITLALNLAIEFIFITADIYAMPQCSPFLACTSSVRHKGRSTP